MTTQVMIDKRRTDLRSYKDDKPMWVTSVEIDEADCEDLAAVLFSFPGAQDFVIHNALVEVTEGFVGGTPSLTIGSCTLATDDITTGGDTTDVDVDDFFTETEAASATPGIKFPGVTADFGAAWVANTGWVITAADATVPAIAAYLTSSTSLTAGKCKIHLLISKLPV